MNRRESIRNASLLAGSAIALPSIMTVLNGCKQTPRLGWTPAFLSTDHAAMLSSMIDIWLPRTDTPGGLDVKADMFIGKVIDQLYDDEGKQYFNNSISKLAEDAKAMFGSSYNDLTTDQKVEFMKAKEKEGGKFNRGVWGTAVGEPQEISFYRSLKSTALWAYFGSEEVGKNVLAYDPIPTAYRGCISLEEAGGKVWSL